MEPSTKTNPTKASDRVLSIDILRGFDMLMIIFADRFFYALQKGYDTPFTRFFANQFDHPEWQGNTFYDIIMPLFLFVVGAVIPFSLGNKLRNGSDKKGIYVKLARRCMILFILGWVVQGNLLALNISQFQIFSNTLQAIAVGYLFSCLAYMYLSKKGRYIFFGACLISYWVLLTIPYIPGLGQTQLEPNKNIAIYIDHLILGRFDDGTQYTWLLSGLGFTATTLSGLFAGELIQSKLSGGTITLRLVIIGISMFAASLLLEIWHPIIKKIWTATFVLWSSGICYILMAIFYWLIDVQKIRKWSFPLKIIGMNAIVAYVLSHIIDFSIIADFVLFGLKPYVGKFYEALTVLGGFGILYVLLWYMYKNKSFVKI